MHGQNTDENTAGGDGRGRDDPCPLADDQGRAAVALCRTENGVLRPGTAGTRAHAGPHHAGRGERRLPAWCGGQMCHHHPQPTARGGVRAVRNVEVPQRHHPRRDGRHRVPRPHRGGYGDVPTAGTRLEATYYHRAARLRRRVQVHRVPCPRRRARRAGLHRPFRAGDVPGNSQRL